MLTEETLNGQTVAEFLGFLATDRFARLTTAEKISFHLTEDLAEYKTWYGKPGITKEREEMRAAYERGEAPAPRVQKGGPKKGRMEKPKGRITEKPSKSKDRRPEKAKKDKDKAKPKKMKKKKKAKRQPKAKASSPNAWRSSSGSSGLSITPPVAGGIVLVLCVVVYFLFGGSETVGEDNDDDGSVDDDDDADIIALKLKLAKLKKKQGGPGDADKPDKKKQPTTAKATPNKILHLGLAALLLAGGIVCLFPKALDFDPVSALIEV
jgi:hypothetical protein